MYTKLTLHVIVLVKALNVTLVQQRTSFPRKRETMRDTTFMQVDCRLRGNDDVPSIKSLVPCTP
jgi:hypothetical protein